MLTLTGLYLPENETFSLHKKMKLSIKCASVNVTKCDLFIFTEEISNEKPHFLCSVCHILHWPLTRFMSLAFFLYYIKTSENLLFSGDFSRNGKRPVA